MARECDPTINFAFKPNMPSILNNSQHLYLSRRKKKNTNGEIYYWKGYRGFVEDRHRGTAIVSISEVPVLLLFLLLKISPDIPFPPPDSYVPLASSVLVLSVVIFSYFCTRKADVEIPNNFILQIYLRPIAEFPQCKIAR